MMEKHILILGLGKSGKALEKLFSQKGISYTSYDDSLSPSSDVTHVIETFKSELFVAASPGIKPAHPLMQLANKHGCRIGTEIDVAFDLYKNSLPPFLGVTGTNGKTTVVEFVSFALTSSGISAEAVGNIGIPLVERLFLQMTPLPKVFVIELSSFQLEYTKRLPLKAAAYLNFAPDHLDWHETMEAYHKAKSSIAAHVEPNGVCLVHSTVPFAANSCLTFSTTMTSDIGTDGETVFYKGHALGPLPENLQGMLLHDTENFLASCGLLVPQFIDYESVKKAWEKFEKGPHRIQFVEKLASLSFWDDSKATNISSTEAAVKWLNGPIVLIAGGVHKGFSYASWKSVFKEKVVSIVAIGQAKEAIYNDLAPEYHVSFAKTLEEAILQASSIVPENGHVLLSPGCSSFDMFANYKDRGDQFQKLVQTHRQRILQMRGVS